MHTLSEHRLIRIWIQDHPVHEDGKAQQSLWYHFGRRQKNSDKMVRESSLLSHSDCGLSSRGRTYEFSPFVRPETGLATKLQELGAAVCADVADEHGTPCTVGMFVEIEAGGYWSGRECDVLKQRSWS